MVRKIPRQSIIPYLNERNVVSNVNVPEVFFDHPDRQIYPIPGAPQNTIFFKNSKQNFLDIGEFKEENVMNLRSKAQSVEVQHNYYNELMYEKKKNNELLQEITVLQNSLKNVNFYAFGRVAANG